MPRFVGREEMLGFIDEVGTYFPTIRRGIEEFRSDPAKADELYEAYRLTHTIKGASSMVGLASMSQIASYQETVLEDLTTGKSSMTDETVTLVSATLTILETYLARLLGGDLDHAPMLSEASNAYRRFRGLPESDDESASRELLERFGPSPQLPEEGAGKAPSTEPSEEIDPADLEAFRSEAEDHLNAIVANLTQYRVDPDRLEFLRRVLGHAHSLKGASGAAGFHPIAHTAHRLEGLVEELLGGNVADPDAAVSLLLATTDQLDDLVKGKVPEDASPVVRLEETPVGAPIPVEVPDLPPIELDDLESIPAELLEVFSMEAEDHIRKIYAALGILEKKPDDGPALREVRHSAHTLKGAAGAVKLRCLSGLAHRMEDLLDVLFDGGRSVSAEIARLLFTTTDALQDLSGGKYDRDVMTATIRALFAGYEAMEGPKVDDPAVAVAASGSAAVSSVIDLGGLALPAAPPIRPKAGRARPSKESRSPRATGEVLRVPIERLDELVRLVSELVINRTSFEQRMTDYIRAVEEHRLGITRLRKVANELETEYEVSTLGGGKLSSAGIPYVDRHRGPAGRLDVEEFDVLELDRYTQFHLLSRSMAEATNDINTVGNEFNGLIGDFDALLNRQRRLSREIQDKLMKVRMVPLTTLTTALHRAVRVVANAQGKLVDLVLEGEHIELDKTVLEEMADPFMHMLRNAVDHGVESPADRVASGKPERATIRVRAFYQGTQVVIQVADDGAGIDPERLRTIAFRDGHISAAESEQMPAEELRQLIFLPGFSTAKQLSEVSGRGVGMDIVKAKVHKLKGTLSVDGAPGAGTTFTIRLPMTLAITRALLVRSNNETFAIPMQGITQILRIEREKIERIGQEPVVRADGKVYPLLQLGDLLGLKQPRDETSAMLPVMIVDAGDRQIALVVDKLLNGREIVVKTLGSHLRHVRGLIGATLMGDGTVIPILNPIELVQSPSRAEVRSSSATSKSRAVPAARNSTVTVLIVDDSLSVRRVVTNLIKDAGWIPITAKDGQEALETLQLATKPPDLILLDIEMPRMDGYELLATLRSEPAYANLPVVMVTSRSGSKHRQKAMELGATDYMVKPFQDGALLGLIRSLVGEPAEALLA